MSESVNFCCPLCISNKSELESEIVRLRSNAEKATELKHALQLLLDAYTCADETGYVDGHGFIDVEQIQKNALLAIEKYSGVN